MQHGLLAGISYGVPAFFIAFVKDNVPEKKTFRWISESTGYVLYTANLCCLFFASGFGNPLERIRVFSLYMQSA